MARRPREIGLRVALGAGQVEVQWLVMREVLQLIGAGVAAVAVLAGYLPARRATRVDP